MIPAGLAIGAVGALALSAIIQATAATPGPAALRSNLAEPVEPGFVEVDQGSSGTLEGPFDSYMYAASLTTDANVRQQITDGLDQGGFVTGYGREWYFPKQSDWLGELVMVFYRASGASSVASTTKINYARDPGFQSFIDLPQIPNSYGLTEIIDGFHWTVVDFRKGNDFYSVARGSNSDFMTTRAIAQAEKAYAVAPAATELLAPTPAPSAWTRYSHLFVVGSLMFGFGVAVSVIAVVYVIASRRRPGVIYPEARPKL
ncbi:MAG TPA: hypothetical protein VFR33_01730 [Candidatus Dormibacteraeota bacterium]|nr:hypothetical protein [Candidatus Dormibacteraeota bacterium]